MVDQTSRRIINRLRWRAAELLERLGWCWADLATWALRWHPFREVERQAPRCSTDPSGCYCGKYRPTEDAS